MAKAKTSGPLVFDYKDSVEEVMDSVKAELKKFKLEVTELPSTDGSDSPGFVISDRKLSKKELQDYEVSVNLRSEDDED